jgi:hypothetical protein
MVYLAPWSLPSEVSKTYNWESSSISATLTEGKTRYNPETNPSGLINLSGSENEGMSDYLERYTKDLLDDFNLTKSRLFSLLFS